MSQKLRRERMSHKAAKWKLAALIGGGILAAACAICIICMLLVFHVPTAPVVHTDPAAAQRLHEELQHAENAAASGDQETVRADEIEINSMFQQYWRPGLEVSTASATAKVRDMRVGIVADHLRLYVLTNLHGREVAFQLEAKLRTVNGYLYLEPLSARIGSLPIPKASLKAAMKKMLATPDGLEAMRLPKNLRDVHVEDGKLVVVFK